MGVITLFMSIASMTNQPCPMTPHDPPTSCQCLYTTGASANKELPHIQLMANGLSFAPRFWQQLSCHGFGIKHHLYSSSLNSSQVKLTGLFLRTLQFDHRFHFSRHSRLKITDLQLPVLVGWKTNTSKDRPHHIQQLKKNPKKINGWMVEAKQLEVWFKWFSFPIFGDF